MSLFGLVRVQKHYDKCISLYSRYSRLFGVPIVDSVFVKNRFARLFCGSKFHVGYVRSCANVRAAQFVWTLDDGVVATELTDDPRRIVNHFGNARITTKAGLCAALRDLPSLASVDPSDFYPRCYDLGNAADR